MNIEQTKSGKGSIGLETEQFETSTKMRVMFVLPNLGAGGAERVTLNFMRQLDRIRFQVYLVVFDGVSELENYVPSHVIKINLGCQKTIKAFYPLLKAIRFIKPHSIYATHSRIVFLLSLIKYLIPTFRLVSRVPNMPSVERLEGYTTPFLAKLYGWAYRYSDCVVVQTSAMKDDVIEEYGIELGKVYVSPNPIDKIGIEERSADNIPDFENGTINIVASGRHARQKGFDNLIKSFHMISADIPSARLYILGRYDDQTQFLKRLISECNLTQRIVLLGVIENPYPYYKKCDLFVLSSRWEGFPNALLENYYLNKPVVATRCVPIISTLVVEGVNGYTVEPNSEVDLAEAMKKAITQGFDEIENPPYEGGDIEALLGSKDAN